MTLDGYVAKTIELCKRFERYDAVVFAVAARRMRIFQFDRESVCEVLKRAGASRDLALALTYVCACLGSVRLTGLRSDDEVKVVTEAVESEFILAEKS